VLQTGKVRGPGAPIGTRERGEVIYYDKLASVDLSNVVYIRLDVFCNARCMSPHILLHC
jgi:hypothetical protein